MGDQHAVQDVSVRRIKLASVADWSTLREEVEHTRSPHQNTDPWRRCLWVAKTSGANIAFLQSEYECRDYTSEFENFYARLHHPPSQYARRLHFFASESNEVSLESPRDHLTRLIEAATTGGADYLGYIVIRPDDLEIVGRSMLKPPPDIVCRTLVEEHVELIGHELAIRAVPFMQQDARYAVCAHVSVWICRHSAHLRDGLSRVTIGDIINNAHSPGESGSHGLNSDEAVRLLERLGTHVFWYDEGDIPEATTETLPTGGERRELLREQLAVENGQMEDAAQRAELTSPSSPLLRRNPRKIMSRPKKRAHFAAAEDRLRMAMSHVVQRTTNSGLPCYVSTGLHAFVVCGYQYDEELMSYTFTIQDDQNGPYIQVRDIMRDYRWDRERQVPTEDLSLPPLPKKRKEWPNPPSPLTYARLKAIADAQGRETELTGSGVPPRFEWREVMLPYPKACLVSPVSAERTSITVFSRELSTLEDLYDELRDRPPASLVRLLEACERSEAGFRTYVTSNEHFKESLEERGFLDDSVALLRSLDLSPQLIVVELLDRTLMSTEPRCYGEVTFDATSNPGAPRVTSVRIDRFLGIPNSDGVLEYSVVRPSLTLTGAPGSIRNAS